MPILTVAHNIFLTREQRYDLFNGSDLEVVGVSVPVWISDNGTTEPAVEVFAKYKLMNRDDRIFIRQNHGQYEITVPPLEVSPNPPPPDDVWKMMSAQEQERWYIQNEPNPSLINLLDVRDGGGEYLAFRQYSKLDKNTGSVGTLQVIHFVEIKDIHDLTDTLN